MDTIADELLKDIQMAIYNDDTNKLTHLLNTLQYSRYSFDFLDALLATFINYCVEYNSNNSIETILDIWSAYIDIITGQLDHLTSLFINERVSDDALKMIVKKYYYTKPIEYYIENLIQHESTPNTLLAVNKLADLFAPVNNNVWQYLYNLSIYRYESHGITNELVESFIKEKLNETGPMIIKPKWIINTFNTLSTHNDLISKLYNKYNIPNIFPIFSSFNAMKIIPRPRESMDQLKELYNQSNEKEKINLLKPYLLSLYRLTLNQNPNIFKVVGPANIMVDADLSLDDPCCYYGGCRMFTCHDYVELPNDIDEFSEINIYGFISWFKGACDFCNNGIPYMHYAVRKPVYNGGWIGCYCSWECVIADTAADEFAVHQLIDIFKKELMTHTIYDRTY